MRSDEVGVGISEVQALLQLPAFFREAQGLPGQPRQLLAEGEIVPLDIGSVNLPLPAIRSPQGGGPSGHVGGLAKDDPAGDGHHPALAAVFNHLRIAQLRMGNARGGFRAPGTARAGRALPAPKGFQEDLGVMGQLIGGKERHLPIESPPDAPEELAGTVEGPIADHRAQPESVFGRHGSPDPRGPHTGPPALGLTRRLSGLPGAGSGCFF